MPRGDWKELLAQGLREYAASGREPLVPPSARADKAGAGHQQQEGLVLFESDLKPYQTKVKQLTVPNLIELLLKLERGGLACRKAEATRPRHAH